MLYDWDDYATAVDEDGGHAFAALVVKHARTAMAPACACAYK